jgi:hypothetical protein
MARRSKEAPRNKLYVINREGERQRVIVNDQTLHQYNSLRDLLKSGNSPIKCESPVPAPTGCVICKSGDVVCAKNFLPNSSSSR